jgi:glycosyltransferase involved in cell wall biosynthesis
MKLSLVVPCYNEQEALPYTVPALEKLMFELIAEKKIAPDSNIWFVDDGSKDETWSLVESAVKRSALFVGIKLSRNRGHQNALLAGLLSADGDAVISIDADLQNDLKVIEEMIDAHRAGYEIVYGVRKTRDTDTWFKRWTALRYYRLLCSVGVEIIPNHADFRLMGRKSLVALGMHTEINLFLRGIIPQLGYSTTSVFYECLNRVAGESKYTLRKMIALGLDGISSFSAVPLRLISALGGVVCLFSMLMVVWALFVRLFTHLALPGWASTNIPIYLLGGVQLLSIGVVGEYISKIYTETKGRPRFLIEKLELHSVLGKQAAVDVTVKHEPRLVIEPAAARVVQELRASNSAQSIS